jgi:hypothetical protein
MSDICDHLHELFNSGRRFRFPFDNLINEIPKNGIYIIFEAGETYRGWDRIVRVGTHTGNNQLRSRLNQHFVKENKNTSIFRKNIGRCFLNQDHHPYASIWELDTTSKADKIKNANLIDRDFEKELEKKLSQYIQTNLSFTVFEVEKTDDRLFWESKIISTLAASNMGSSINWLGRHSPKEKIRKYCLWQVNELFNEQLNAIELIELNQLLTNTISR